MTFPIVCSAGTYDNNNRPIPFTANIMDAVLLNLQMPMISSIVRAVALAQAMLPVIRRLCNALTKTSKCDLAIG